LIRSLFLHCRDMNERPEDQDRPQPPAVQAHRFTNDELEAVIRRAVELQAGSPGRADDGLSDTDIVRIGQELGLESGAVRRAMAEVRTRGGEESGALDTVVGGRTVRAVRVVKRPAAGTLQQLDRYLRDVELMVPQRRFPERTRYERDSSLAAGLARFTRGLSRSHKPLGLERLDVAVTALDRDSCLVELGIDMAATRGGLLAGVMGSTGAAATAWSIVVWATAIADPLMLVGIPALAGSWFGTRAIYGSIRRSAQDKLESLLDRVEHDDLT
jgi:hypothetical protein